MPSREAFRVFFRSLVMRILRQLRALPLRAKVVLTFVTAAIVLVGAATSLSFRYWEDQALVAAESQARLATVHAGSSLDAAIRTGSEGLVRRQLVSLLDDGVAIQARIYGVDGRIAFSTTPGEEGLSRTGVWVPASDDLPPAGVVHRGADPDMLRVFVPLAAPGVSLLELATSIAPMRTAMRRGALLGVALAAGSIVALAVLVGAFLEWEVISPLEAVERTLARETGRTVQKGDQLRDIRHSVKDLLDQQRASEARQAGLAQVGELATEMAHEFKRPLASIRTGLDMVEQEYRLDPAGREAMSLVHQQLDRLSETMQDLFSLAHPVEIDRRDVSVEETLDDALLEVAGMPGAERMTVVRKYGDTSPVPGDERRLRQAFANLMTNALEAMPDGGTLTLTTAEDEAGDVVVTVADTGPGLPPDEADRIFRPFYSTKPHGTGLGLPLVARVVGAHGGSTTIDTAPGEGTRVRIRLPASGRTAGTEPTHEPTEEPWRGTASSSSTTTA